MTYNPVVGWISKPKYEIFGYPELRCLVLVYLYNRVKNTKGEDITIEPIKVLNYFFPKDKYPEIRNRDHFLCRRIRMDFDEFRPVYVYKRRGRYAVRLKVWIVKEILRSEGYDV